MTGSTLTGKPKSGTWTVVYDSGTAGAEWGSLDWTADVPGDATLAFTVASSNDGVTFGPAQAAVDGVDLTLADGRYLRITATATRASTGAVVDINGSVGAMSCQTSGTGECTVTLGSSAPGISTLTASFAGLAGSPSVDSALRTTTWVNPVILITARPAVPTIQPGAVSPGTLPATAPPDIPVAVQPGQLPVTGAGLRDEGLSALLLMGAGIILRTLGRQTAGRNFPTQTS